MLNQQPIPIQIPKWGVTFVESRHHPEFQMGSRTDAYHKFFLVNEGSLTLYHDGSESTPVDAQTIFFIPAETPHRLEDRTPTSLLILCVNEEFPDLLPTFKPVWQKLANFYQKPVLPSGLLSQRIESLWRKGINEQQLPTSFTPVNQQILAIDIMVNLVQAAAYPRKRDPRMRIAQLNDLLKAEYYEHRDVERAASVVQLSRRRFSDYFKEITGKSFIEQLTRIRIEKAQQFMRLGEYSIAGAGFSSGFNDLSHFYRMFKKYVGQTPGEWLRKEQEKNSATR
jgi:AraC family L-rhamnose operon regulatory protein RhaS